MNQKIMLKSDDTIKMAVEIMEQEKVLAVFVVDDGNRLMGIFTQGDLRRYILRNGKIDNNISEAMNTNPKTFHDRSCAKKSNMVAPIVDSEGRLIDVINNDPERRKNIYDRKCLKHVPLVIMAGGMGTRLYPLTKILPKALIPIGEYTIIERIINNFVSWGCQDVYVIINYKGEMIKTYFEDKEKNYNLHFVQEKEFLGTGGGLSLLRDIINTTFILSNCDILVEADYDCLIKTHKMKNNDVTFVGAYQNMKIPYGVIQTNMDGEVLELTEKPEVSFLTNSGVYVIEPEIIKGMPQNTFCNMTDLAMEYKEKGKKVGVFPVSSIAWKDMGQIDEMKSMIKSFEN